MPEFSGFCAADGAALATRAAEPMAPILGWDNPHEWGVVPLPMPVAGSPRRAVLREILRARNLTSDGLLLVAEGWVQDAIGAGTEAADLLAAAEFCRAIAPLFSDVPLCPHSRALAETGTRFDIPEEAPRHG